MILWVTVGKTPPCESHLPDPVLDTREHFDSLVPYGSEIDEVASPESWWPSGEGFSLGILVWIQNTRSQRMASGLAFSVALSFMAEAKLIIVGHARRGL
ncbi:hypothetical protein RRG08_044758 [Elysia crispata]|uniref:Uncharacterized protein n=1 Tax=Elysia crispata TaxID=231223 RepID=A0AAE0ZHS6_9GAST|nr:hypothetical protein RRG08_044758 [Elysia crispata]